MWLKYSKNMLTIASMQQIITSMQQMTKAGKKLLSVLLVIKEDNEMVNFCIKEIFEKIPSIETLSEDPEVVGYANELIGLSTFMLEQYAQEATCFIKRNFKKAGIRTKTTEGQKPHHTWQDTLNEVQALQRHREKCVAHDEYRKEIRRLMTLSRIELMREIVELKFGKDI